MVDRKLMIEIKKKDGDVDFRFTIYY